MFIFYLFVLKLDVKREPPLNIPNDSNSSHSIHCLDFLQINYADDENDTNAQQNDTIVIDDSPKKRKRNGNKRKASSKTAAKEKQKDTPVCRTLVYNGNKFFLYKKTNRKWLWRCSTSRFTNCTAELNTNPKGNEPLEVGSHDHANNTE